MREVFDRLKTPVKLGAVIREDGIFCESPGVFNKDGLWYMMYVSISAKEEDRGFETFACSDDLTDWTHWQGETLVAPAEGYNDLYAHKPYIVSHKSKVYHFYCACNTKGERFIALAVSE